MSPSELERILTQIIGSHVSKDNSQNAFGNMKMYQEYIDTSLHSAWYAESAALGQEYNRIITTQQNLIKHYKEEHSKGVITYDKLQESLDAVNANFNEAMDAFQVRTASRKQRLEQLKSRLKVESNEKWQDGISMNRAGAFRMQGKQITNFGDALNMKLPKPLNKLGNTFKVVGKIVTKFAWVLAILQVAFELAAIAIQNDTEHVKIKQKREQARFKHDMAVVNSLSQQAQASLAAASERASAITSTYGRLGLMGLQNGANGYVASEKLASKMIFDIEGSAFAAAQDAISIAAGHLKYENATKFGLASLSKRLGAISAAESAAIKSAQADIGLAGRELQREYQRDDLEDRLVDIQSTKQAVQTVTMLDDGGATNAYARLQRANLEGKLQWESLNDQHSTARQKLIYDLQADRARGAASLYEIQAQQQQQARDAIIDAAMKIKQAWLGFTQSVVKYYHETENSAYEVGRGMGYSGEQLQKFAKHYSELQVSISELEKSELARNAKDMAKLQTTYQQTTGRNIQLGKEDFQAAFSNMVFMDENSVTGITSGMEIFNYSVKEANIALTQSWAEVTRMGMSGRKYSELLNKNMKLAEKFNFKRGVKGLMDMSIWALKMRFNMASADKMLTTFRNGDINDIIQRSAQLRVLGGRMGMRSDPLGMAYDAFNDPQSLAERLQDMSSSLGMWDPETGKVSFGQYGQEFAYQISQAMNIPVQDILNMGQQAQRLEQINSYMGENTTKFNAEEMSFIEEKADYKDGKWTLNVQGERKDLQDLSIEDVKSIYPQNIAKSKLKTLQQIVGVAQSMIGTEDKMKNAQYNMMGRVTDATWMEIRTGLIDSYKRAWEEYTKNFQVYKLQLEKGLTAVVNAQREFFLQFQRGNAEIDAAVNNIHKLITSIGNTIKADFAQGLGQIGKALAAQISAGLQIPHNIKQPESSNGDNIGEWKQKYTLGTLKEGTVTSGTYQLNDDALGEYDFRQRLELLKRVQAVDRRGWNSSTSDQLMETAIELFRTSLHNDNIGLPDLLEQFQRHMVKLGGYNGTTILKYVKMMEQLLENSLNKNYRYNNDLYIGTRLDSETTGNVHRSRSSGGYTDRIGFTSDGSIDSPDGYVGTNQWVASQKIVNNATLRPVLDYLNDVQMGVKPQPLIYDKTLAMEDPDNYPSLYDYLSATNQSMDFGLNNKPNIDISVDTLNINGRLELVQGNQSVDLISLVKTDRSLQQTIVNYIISAMA